MKTVWIKIVGIASVTAFLVLCARYLIGGNEDSWICFNGHWIRHGNPASSQPTTPCENNE